MPSGRAALCTIPKWYGYVWLTLAQQLGCLDFDRWEMILSFIFIRYPKIVTASGILYIYIYNRFIRACSTHFCLCSSGILPPAMFFRTPETVPAACFDPCLSPLKRNGDGHGGDSPAQLESLGNYVMVVVDNGCYYFNIAMENDNF